MCGSAWLPHVLRGHQYEGGAVPAGCTRTAGELPQIYAPLPRVYQHINPHSRDGVTLSLSLFWPQKVTLGLACQWLVKPALGVIIAATLVPALRLPQAISTGLILVRDALP